MDGVAASLANIKARIDGGMDWEGTNLDYAFAMSDFDVATLQHHMVDEGEQEPTLASNPATVV